MTPDERDLTHLENLDQVDRYKWSKIIAYTFITMKPRAVMMAIAAGGFDLFLSRAHEQYAGHQLRHEDYRRAFDWIAEAAARAAQGPMH